MQKQIMKAGDLLDARGRLATSGWATQPLLRYDRGRVRASPLRVKEWDYYEIINPSTGSSCSSTTSATRAARW